MDKRLDDGGPAFPGKICVGHSAGDEVPIYKHPSRMSLLHFATIEIMKGIVSNPYIISGIRKPLPAHEVIDKQVAEYAVRLAIHTINAVKARKDKQ